MTIRKRPTSGILPCIIGALIAYILLGVVFVAGVVPSASMAPTLNQGRLLVALRLHGEREFARGDIVIFQHNGKMTVKRIVGLPGETIYVGEDGVSIGGAALDEPYAHGSSAIINHEQKGRSYQIPEGHVFLLGDNREDSLDSRYWDYPYIATTALIAILDTDCAIRRNPV